MFGEDNHCLGDECINRTLSKQHDLDNIDSQIHYSCINAIPSKELAYNISDIHNDFVDKSSKMFLNQQTSKDFSMHRLSSKDFKDDHISSYFYDVELAYQSPLNQLITEFKADSFSKKINLAIRAYRTNEGVPWILPVVNYVEAQMSMDPLLHHEYLPAIGLLNFCDAAMKFCLGENSIAIVENRAGAIQTLSGTGALRLAAEFLHKYYNTRESSTQVFIPDPTWENHEFIFRSAGYVDIHYYKYWNAEGKCLDFSGMISDLKKAKPFSIVLFHACAHYPTGLDPSQEEWEILAEVCEEKRLFPVFDCAFQGLASQDPAGDAWAVRYFVKIGFEMLICQSFSKTFGIYDARIGNLVVVVRDGLTQMKCRSQLQRIVETIYLNPPSHGARIVASVLNNPALYHQWIESLKKMVDRITKLRHLFHMKLRMLGTHGVWDHIIKQTGLFCFTGISRFAAVLIDLCILNQYTASLFCHLV